MTEIRWTCQCGKSGWIKVSSRSPAYSLAGMVRQARRIHRCPDPDIISLETREEYDRRIFMARFHPGVI
jgi:hypothetical protein